MERLALALFTAPRRFSTLNEFSPVQVYWLASARVRFKITSVELTVPGTLLLSETWLITNFPATEIKTLPCLDQRIGGSGNPVAIQVNTANAE